MQIERQTRAQIHTSTAHSLWAGLPRCLSGKEPTCQAGDMETREEPLIRRKKWQPSPVFLPGKPHGQGSLEGYSPQVKELDLTEATRQQPYRCSSCSVIILPHEKATKKPRGALEITLNKVQHRTWKNFMNWHVCCFVFCSVSPNMSSIPVQSRPTLCNPMNHSTPGLPVHHQLPELTHTHIHRASDAIQPSHPLLSPSPPAFNLSQHQSLFQWVSSS